jgi:hypothetical protein
MYLILFSAHKNIDYKTNTHLFTPQDAAAAYLNYSKGEEQKDGQTSSNGFEWLAGSTKKLVLCWGRKWSAEGQTVMAAMIGGHRSVAKGVGERADQQEGLYLGCRLRYSCQKRLPG